jgi:hypothetical protein
MEYVYIHLSKLIKKFSYDTTHLRLNKLCLKYGNSMNFTKIVKFYNINNVNVSEKSKKLNKLNLNQLVNLLAANKTIYHFLTNVLKVISIKHNLLKCIDNIDKNIIRYEAYIESIDKIISSRIE